MGNSKGKMRKKCMNHIPSFFIRSVSLSHFYFLIFSHSSLQILDFYFFAAYVSILRGWQFYSVTVVDVKTRINESSETEEKLHWKIYNFFLILLSEDKGGENRKQERKKQDRGKFDGRKMAITYWAEKKIFFILYSRVSVWEGKKKDFLLDVFLKSFLSPTLILVCFNVYVCRRGCDEGRNYIKICLLV